MPTRDRPASRPKLERIGQKEPDAPIDSQAERSAPVLLDENGRSVRCAGIDEGFVEQRLEHRRWASERQSHVIFLSADLSARTQYVLDCRSPVVHRDFDAEPSACRSEDLGGRWIERAPG